LVILTPPLMTQIEKTAEIIGSFSQKYQQPILCSFIGGTLTTAGEKVLDGLRIPSFPFPERAIKTLAAMWQWQKNRKTLSPANAGVSPLKKGDLESFDVKLIEEVLAEAKEKGQASLDNIQANKLMEILGVPTPPTAMVKSLEEAIEFCKAESGWPVVLKLSAPGLLHKADIGGVITQINDQEKLAEAMAKLTQIIENLDPNKEKGMQIQIQKEIDGGVETILGIKRDPSFGAVMLFGAGGTLAELLSDRNIHLLPIDEERAKKLTEGSRIFPMLNGFRGALPFDLKPLYKVMQVLAKLVEEVPEISEVEINPLKIMADGVWALDPKVVLAEGVK
jgi:acetyltransferase